MAEWDEIKTEADNRGRGAGVGAFETLKGGFAKASGWNAEPFQTPIPSPNITLPPNRGPIAQGGIGKALVESGWTGTKPGSTTIQQPTVSASVTNRGIANWEGPQLKNTAEIPSAIDYTVNKYAPITNKDYAGLKVPAQSDLTKVVGISPPSEGAVYQYTTPDGTIAYTDSLDKVPPGSINTVDVRTWGDVGRNKFNVVTGESLAGVGEKGIGQLFGGSQVVGGGGGEAGYTGGYVGGIPSGQKHYESLVAKEEALYGPGGKPEKKEFNQDEFNSIVRSFGGYASTNLKADLYKSMLQRNESHNKAIDDMEKARMQYGENSIQATHARQTLEHQRHMQGIAEREHPVKMEHQKAQTGLLKEQTMAVGPHAAREEKMGQHLEDQNFNARQTNLLNEYKAIVKTHENNLLVDPKIRQQNIEKATNDYLLTKKGMEFAEQVRKKFPQYTVPGVVLPGQIYEFAKGKKFKIGDDWSINPA